MTCCKRRTDWWRPKRRLRRLISRWRSPTACPASGWSCTSANLPIPGARPDDRHFHDQVVESDFSVVEDAKPNTARGGEELLRAAIYGSCHRRVIVDLVAVHHDGQLLPNQFDVDDDGFEAVLRNGDGVGKHQDGLVACGEGGDDEIAALLQRWPCCKHTPNATSF